MIRLLFMIPFLCALTACALIENDNGNDGDDDKKNKAESETAYIAEARGAIEAFFKGFNARDDNAVRKSLNYPHIRMASGNVNIVQRAEDYATGYDRLTSREGWDRSTLDSVKVRQHEPDKVHFEIVFSRYKKDGTKYATYDSLWIVTKVDGRWGVQCRSSFAP
jgi:hypothetical protein